MRIISGKYRGKKLLEFGGQEIRPTSDRAREALFSILQFNIEGTRFLDGFCGTGAIGIEALSRGAEEVVFTDLSKQSCEITNKNLSSVGERVRAKNIDLLKYLSGESKPFDIIFLDPPYDSPAGKKALEIIARRKLLTPNGVAILESKSAFNGVIEGLFVEKTKKYGIANLTFFKSADLTTCVFAGSFDPVTKGHDYIVTKAKQKFDKVIVALGHNENKKYKFDKYTRLKMLSKAFENRDGIEVVAFDGMLVDFLRERKVIYNVRGIRNQADMDYEQDMYAKNKQNYPEIQNVYINSSEQTVEISSTLAREKLEKGEIPEELHQSTIEIIKNLS